MFHVPENFNVPKMIPLEQLMKSDNGVAKESGAASHEAQQPVRKPEAARLRIVELRGPLGGFNIPCTRSVVFGRSPKNCNVVFPENTRGVSKVHCEISIQNGGLLLRDLNSSYGTYLGTGERIAPGQAVLLKKGDIFYLASKEVMFQIQ